MKAQVLESFEGPQGFQLRDVEEPRIESPDDVKIQVDACGVCHRDITWSRGKFGRAELPKILGHEGAGVVLEVGSAVEDLKPGDRVVHLQFPYCGRCEACKAGRPAACANLRAIVGEGRNGCYAERVVLPAPIVTRVPDGISAEQAASAACTLGTAYHALRLYGFEPAGKIVALNGAGGGVGIHAIQIAKLLGARVIAVTTSATKAQAIGAAGADHVVVAGDGTYSKQVRELTGGRGADLFVEIVGAPMLEQSLLSVRRGGRVVVVGNPDGGGCHFNPALLILRGELMLYGSLAVTMAELKEILAFMSAGKLRPSIDRVAPLEDLPDAMRQMEQRGTTGRVIVRLARAG